MESTLLRLLSILNQQSHKPILTDLLQIGDTLEEYDQEAQQLLQELQKFVLKSPAIIQVKSVVRVYMASCSDVIHSGHFNGFRQSKKMGDYLIVAVVTDEEMMQAKGNPVMSWQERAAVVRACKWVDEVIPGKYYVNNEILNQYGCDFCTHGDDLAVDKRTGRDAYAEVKQSGRLKVFKRTEGVSTTDLVGKMLLMYPSVEQKTQEMQTVEQFLSKKETKFLPTSRRIASFANHKSPQENDKIIYIDGSFDLIHCGHVEVFEKAKQHGDFLIVGIHDDKTVRDAKGLNFPIMEMFERALNVLAIKYVDDIIIGAPWKVSNDMLKTLNIQKVLRGSIHSYKQKVYENPQDDPYYFPKQQGIYQEIESVTDLDIDKIIDRIIQNQMKFGKRVERTGAIQKEYYENKGYVPES